MTHFIIGVFVGAFIGVAVMAILNISTDDEDEGVYRFEDGSTNEQTRSVINSEETTQ